jgi:hypothetical protein
MEENIHTYLEGHEEYGEPNQGYLIFGWYITEDVTAKDGNITFSVRFYQTDEATKRVIFNISTIPSTIKILPSFSLRDDKIGHEQFAPRQYEGLSLRANYAGVINSMGVKPVIVYYSWMDKPYINFTDDNGVEVTVIAKDLDEANAPLLFRWIDEFGKDVVGANTTPGAMTEQGYPCSCTLSAAGIYYAMVGNYVTDSGDLVQPAEDEIDWDRIAWITSQPIFIPSAGDVTLDLSGVALKGYTTAGNFTDIVPVTSLNVSASVAENGEDGKFIYTWYKNGEVIQEASTNSQLMLTDAHQNGNFYVSAHYHINGTDSNEVNTQDEMIILRPAPVQPDANNFTINFREQSGVYECLPRTNEVDIEDLYYYWTVYDNSASEYKTVKTWSADNSIALADIERILGDKAFSQGDTLICKAQQIRFIEDERLMRESAPSGEISYSPASL